MNSAGITANGSHDLPPPAVTTGIPGAVDTNNGGPSSATGTGAGAAAGARRGTGTTDCSVGVPLASGASGRTGRHITIVVVWAAVPLAGFGVTRLARRTTGRRAPVATFFGLTVATAFFGTAARAAVVRRRTTGFFFTGAATGVHSTSESTDALRTTGFCATRGVVSRRTTCPPAELGADTLATINAEIAPTMN
jgi:hypothetical protein